MPNDNPAVAPHDKPASVPLDIAASLVTEALDWVWRNAGAGALAHIDHTLVGYEQRGSLLVLDFETSSGERHQVALRASSLQVESAPVEESALQARIARRRGESPEFSEAFDLAAIEIAADTAPSRQEPDPDRVMGSCDVCSEVVELHDLVEEGIDFVCSECAEDIDGAEADPASSAELPPQARTARRRADSPEFANGLDRGGLGANPVAAIAASAQVGDFPKIDTDFEPTPGLELLPWDHDGSGGTDV